MANCWGQLLLQHRWLLQKPQVGGVDRICSTIAPLSLLVTLKRRRTVPSRAAERGDDELWGTVLIGNSEHLVEAGVK